MLKPITFVYISLFAFLAVSCKNETEATKPSEVKNNTTEITQIPVKRAAKKDLTPEDIAMLKSVMSRVMTDAELKKFASYAVSAGLADKLSNDKGPFTVFALSNTAIESMSAEKKKFYANPENLSKLEEMLKSYIVTGNLDNETLLRDIGKKKKLSLKTLSGKTLIASKSGESIVISDEKDGKAKVINKGTEASNGVVYVIDAVLNSN